MSPQRVVSLRRLGSLHIHAALLVVALFGGSAYAREDKPAAAAAADDPVATRAVRPPGPVIGPSRFPPGALRPPPPPTLSLVSTNIANGFALQGISWEMKMDRLASLIIASGQAPCQFDAAQSFSDHCGLLVRLSE